MSQFDKQPSDRFAPWAEPTQAATQAAHELWHLFVAMVREGFTPSQALDVVKTMLIAQMGGR
jgi:hypothetical protein